MIDNAKQYIHYGSTNFDINKFNKVKNRTDWTKPYGGFWASSIDAKWGWKHWCKSEDFMLDRLEASVVFSLKDNAKVYHIYSVSQLKGLPKCDNKYSSFYLIDFELTLKRYDAIELHLSEEVCDDFEKSLYFKLWGWDCDSILIMNPNIIVA